MTRTAHLGFGPIGEAVFGLIRERELATPVGIADLDVDRVRAKGAAGGWADVAIAPSLSDLSLRAGDVVVQCTGSRLNAVGGQIDEALRLGASVVSTCEELSYPWLDHGELAEQLDRRARAAGAVVIATGVNPGFMMDAVPMFMSAVTRRLDAVRVSRVVDAARRRGPLQSKVGAGLTPDAFAELAAAGKLGHVGLRESAAMLAAATGLSATSVTTTLEPVLAERPVRTEVVNVSQGEVAGIHQVAIAWSGSTPVVTLDLRMYVGAPAELDEIELLADPLMKVTTSGVHGDVATAAMVANLVGELKRLEPGVRTMIDLVPVRAHPPAGAAER